jgi:N-methyl-L-tryptophan oxidase
MQYDTIVVGAGSMGMAAGYFLAKQGKQVLLIDAFDPPHSNGSHHGETRIIRHAYGEGEKYVPLALRAQQLWEELQQEANMDIFLKTGVINIGKRQSEFVREVQESARKHSLPLEILSAEEMNAKWPGLTFPEQFIGCLETNSGVLFSENCIKAYRRLACELGATIKTNSPVKNISLFDNSVTVETEESTFKANSLLLCAGAASTQLLQSINISIPVQPVRKTFSWFSTPESDYGSETFPAFTINSDEGMYYGFPNIAGAGLKIGRHDGGQEIDSSKDVKAYGSFTNDEGDVMKVLRSYFSNVGQLKQGKTCMYSNTPDGDFVIDYHPNYSNVVIAAGFSGHGFKFSSVVGEILSQMILEKPIPFDLAPFSLKRF